MRNPRLRLATLAAALALGTTGGPVGAETVIIDLAPRPIDVRATPEVSPQVEAPPTKPSPPERVVTDRHSGVAISGYDPVAYFEGTPSPGLDAYELTYAGVVWRFRSAANRAAFGVNPEVYAPRFGGHDPVGLARGVGLPGHPKLWRMHANRLYLFYTSTDRDAFAGDPDAVIDAAERAWPDVVKSILP